MSFKIYFSYNLTIEELVVKVITITVNSMLKTKDGK